MPDVSEAVLLSSSGTLSLYGYIKAKLPLYFLNEHHAMKAYWGVGVYLYAFLTSALD
jgi:hypothetical protein